MKKYAILLYVFAYFIASCSIQNKIIINQDNDSYLKLCESIPDSQKYIVDSITVNGDFYIITLSRNDSIFRVISLLNKKYAYKEFNYVDSCITTNTSIKKGNKYCLNLDTLYKDKNCDILSMGDAIWGGGSFTFYFSTIPVLEECEVLYISKNLNGLTIINCNRPN